MTLPLAWGLSWRAIRQGSIVRPRGCCGRADDRTAFRDRVSGAPADVVWPFVSWNRSASVGRALRRVLAGALVASAWVIVPLIAERNYAATNEILHHTPLVNGYGAERVLSWLVTGQLLDAGRLPVVTMLTESVGCRGCSLAKG